MQRSSFLILAAVLAASPAFAQTGATPATTRVPVAPLPIDARPKLADYPVIAKLNGSALRAGFWEYATTISADTEKVEAGTRVMRVVSVGSGAGRQWLVVDQQNDGQIQSIDSLFLTYQDLRAVRRRVTAGALEITNVARPDSIVGVVSMKGSTRPISLPNRPGMNLTASQFEVMVRALPLKLGYRGRTELAAIMPQGNVIFPILLEVFGDARITVPAGTFDTWQLRIRTPSGDQRVWIAKQGGFVVQSRAPSLRRLGWVSTTVLVKKG